MRICDGFLDHPFLDEPAGAFAWETTAHRADVDIVPGRGSTPPRDQLPTTDDVRTHQPSGHVSPLIVVPTADDAAGTPLEQVLQVPPPAVTLSDASAPGDTEIPGVGPYALAGLSGHDHVARSNQRLQPPAVHVLRALGAMAGGGAPEAIAAVAGGGLAEGAVSDALALLVGLQLATTDPTWDRYALTSSGTEHLRRQWSGGGEADGYVRRHAGFFAAQARAFGRRVPDAGVPPAWLLDHPNRLRALATLRRTGDRQRALQLVVDSMIGFVHHGELDAGRRALTEVLSETAETTSRARIQAHLWLGRLEAEQADGVQTTTAQAHFDMALRLARERGDVGIHLQVLNALCENQFVLEDGVRLCEAAVAEGLALPDAPESEVERTVLLAWHAANLHRRGHLEEAAATIGQAIEVARRHGDHRLMMTFAIVHWQLPPEVRRENLDVPALTELLQVADAQSDLRTTGRAWVIEVGDRVERFDDRRAITGCLEMLRFARRTTNQPVARQALVAFIRLLGRHPSPALAARLSGALVTHGEAVAAQMPPRWTADLMQSVAAARRELGEAAFDDARREGLAAGQLAALDLAEQGLSALLDELLLESFDGSSYPGPGRLAVLTARERQVLDALAAGGSNKEIAAQLGMRPKTVAHHCATIYTKLGVRNRTEAVAEGFRSGPGHPTGDHPGRNADTADARGGVD